MAESRVGQSVNNYLHNTRLDGNGNLLSNLETGQIPSTLSIVRSA
jgi:hypothetical protein